MGRDLTSIIADFRNLTKADFDTMTGAAGVMRLDELCAEVSSFPEPASAFPEFFALIERLSDCELGSPGPLVHTMERHSGRYEQLLADSIRRKPTEMTVWMA